MSTQDDSDEFDYHVINDGLGISHVLRRWKGENPAVRCEDCEKTAPKVEKGPVK